MKSPSDPRHRIPLECQPARSLPDGKAEMTDFHLRCREALVLWLRWNEAYEHATAHMFQSGADRERVDALLDEMDRLRYSAVALSHELLD